jgi:hypothetical protein
MVVSTFNNSKIKRKGQWLGNSSRWQRHMLGCRYIYLGLFDSEVEAARLMILDSAIDEKNDFFFTFLIFQGLSTDSILLFFFSFLSYFKFQGL